MAPSRPSEEYQLTASPYRGNLSTIPRYEAGQDVQQSHSEGASNTNRGIGDHILSHRVGRVSPWHAKPRAESVRGRIIRVPGPCFSNRQSPELAIPVGKLASVLRTPRAAEFSLRA
jgi:hypothetical protein